MEEILVLAIQFLIEVVFNVVVSMPFEFAFMTRRDGYYFENWTIQAIVWFIVGVVIGGISTALFNHALISIGALRIVNLLAAPPAAAYLAQAIAERWRQSNPTINPRIHFWQTFSFTLGLVLIRFAYASRL